MPDFLVTIHETRAVTYKVQAPTQDKAKFMAMYGPTQNREEVDAKYIPELDDVVEVKPVEVK